MEITVHIHHHFHPEKDDQVSEHLKRLFIALKHMEHEMANELQTLTDQVAASVTVQESAIKLLTGLKAALDAAIASGNPAALTALSESLATEQQKMVEALTINTPVAANP